MEVYGRGDGIEVGPRGRTIRTIRAAERAVREYGLELPNVLKKIRVPIENRRGLTETIEDLQIKMDEKTGKIYVTGLYRFIGKEYTNGWLQTKEINYEKEPAPITSLESRLITDKQ